MERQIDGSGVGMQNRSPDCCGTGVKGEVHTGIRILSKIKVNKAQDGLSAAQLQTYSSMPSANLVQRVVEERAGRLSSSGGEVAGLQAIRLMWQVCVSVRVTSGSAVGTARFAE